MASEEKISKPDVFHIIAVQLDRAAHGVKAVKFFYLIFNNLDNFRKKAVEDKEVSKYIDN